ncbi:MAG: acyl-CoA/acyl-ACP dehydrogenase [Actinobacteria bacterium]|nr:acyl-CoA/acyl-ACP dehydrogenase [Actinomycetota bacterium]MBU1944226.1 acyl-CoA/acyl-ACP dehydrogenase [Actinomycetota bacterium]MBU2688381.1 acyl-CoA/acyl-ACP dehydrogenase [Actinomycetota bacterium]
MEWFENEELTLIAETVRDLSARELEGKVVDLERLEKPEFPRPAIDKFSELGFLWGLAPEDLGSGMDRITTVVILSELAKTCAGFASIVACHYSAVDAVLSVPGGLSVLEAACAGSGPMPLFGVCVPDRVLGTREGSDSCLAMPAPDKVDRVVVLTGSDPGARLLVASGGELRAFVAEKVGLSGCDEMPAARLTLPDTIPEVFEVHASGADAGRGHAVLVSSLKLYFSAIMQGAARSATAYALGYAKERRQTGRPIVFHQNVYKKLAEMETANQAMASFLFRAACNGEGLEAMLFAFVKAQSEHVASEAVQNLGGYGYMREYGLEKKLRDIKTLQALLPTLDSFPLN